jgi:hypothetical protein
VLHGESANELCRSLQTLMAIDCIIRVSQRNGKMLLFAHNADTKKRKMPR